MKLPLILTYEGNSRHLFCLKSEDVTAALAAIILIIFVSSGTHETLVNSTDFVFLTFLAAIFILAMLSFAVIKISKSERVGFYLLGFLLFVIAVVLPTFLEKLCFPILIHMLLPLIFIFTGFNFFLLLIFACLAAIVETTSGYIFLAVSFEDDEMFSRAVSQLFQFGFLSIDICLGILLHHAFTLFGLILLKYRRHPVQCLENFPSLVRLEACASSILTQYNQWVSEASLLTSLESVKSDVLLKALPEEYHRGRGTGLRRRLPFTTNPYKGGFSTIGGVAADSIDEKDKQREQKMNPPSLLRPIPRIVPPLSRPTTNGTLKSALASREVPSLVRTTPRDEGGARRKSQSKGKKPLRKGRKGGELGETHIVLWEALYFRRRVLGIRPQKHEKRKYRKMAAKRKAFQSKQNASKNRRSPKRTRAESAAALQASRSGEMEHTMSKSRKRRRPNARSASERIRSVSDRVSVHLSSRLTSSVWSRKSAPSGQRRSSCCPSENFEVVRSDDREEKTNSASLPSGTQPISIMANPEDLHADLGGETGLWTALCRSVQPPSAESLKVAGRLRLVGEDENEGEDEEDDDVDYEDILTDNRRGFSDESLFVPCSYPRGSVNHAAVDCRWSTQMDSDRREESRRRRNRAKRLSRRSTLVAATIPTRYPPTQSPHPFSSLSRRNRSGCTGKEGKKKRRPTGRSSSRFLTILFPSSRRSRCSENQRKKTREEKTATHGHRPTGASTFRPPLRRLGRLKKDDLLGRRTLQRYWRRIQRSVDRRMLILRACTWTSSVLMPSQTALSLFTDSCHETWYIEWMLCYSQKYYKAMVKIYYLFTLLLALQSTLYYGKMLQRSSNVHSFSPLKDVFLPIVRILLHILLNCSFIIPLRILHCTFASAYKFQLWGLLLAMTQLSFGTFDLAYEQARQLGLTQVRWLPITTAMLIVPFFVQGRMPVYLALYGLYYLLLFIFFLVVGNPQEFGLFTICFFIPFCTSVFVVVRCLQSI